MGPVETLEVKVMFLVLPVVAKFKAPVVVVMAPRERASAEVM